MVFFSILYFYKYKMFQIVEIYLPETRICHFSLKNYFRSPASEIHSQN